MWAVLKEQGINPVRYLQLLQTENGWQQLCMAVSRPSQAHLDDVEETVVHAVVWQVFIAYARGVP